MKSVGVIWEPHHMTNCARVSVTDQQGTEENIVIICCSPGYNGVYKYPAEKKTSYDIWMNGKLACYCVPMRDLERCGNLADLNDYWKSVVKHEQAVWCKRYRSKKQPWMLE